jgi:hypothetical protein
MELTGAQLLSRWIYGTFKGRRIGILVLVAGVLIGLIGVGGVALLKSLQLEGWAPYWMGVVLVVQLLFPLLYSSTLANLTLYYPDSFEDGVEVLGFKEIFARLPNGLLFLGAVGIVLGIWGGLFSIGVWINGDPLSLQQIGKLPGEMLSLSPGGLYCWLIFLLFLLFLYPFFGKVGGGLGVEESWRSFLEPLSTFWDFKFLLGSLNRRYWVAFSTFLPIGVVLGSLGMGGIGITFWGIVTGVHPDPISLLIGASWGVGVGTPAISLLLNLLGVTGGYSYLVATKTEPTEKGVANEG